MSFKTIIAIALLAASAVSTCDAQSRHQARRARNRLDFQRNLAWPQPFITRDRLASCSFFDLMAENGWSQQSTLTPFHFDAKSQQLTEVGKAKVRQILTQQPEKFRTLFVSAGEDNRISAQRVAAVQQAASEVLPVGSLPDVRQVAIPPRGLPAEYSNSISKKFAETLPTPRLQ